MAGPGVVDSQVKDKKDKDCVMAGSQVEDEDDDECDHMEEFATVLANMNLNLLPNFASSVRRSNLHTKEHDSVKECNPVVHLIGCKVTSPPLYGSFHIAFPIDFDDGTRWILKVPAEGHRDEWSDTSARELESEARTMQLLKRKSKIPIPEVYSFDGCLENELNCPYILMEYIDGIQADSVWHNETDDGTSLEKRRTRILESVAAAMVQLNDFVYNQAGPLKFDDEGNTVGVDAITVDDMCVPGFDKTFWSKVGPFTEAKSYLRRFIDCRHQPGSNISDGRPMTKSCQGIYELLRLFLDWIPMVSHEEGLDFVLTHPDFNLQNILVTEEGELLALIDWDGVRAVPRCIGCESYPDWLTRDWDPCVYAYDSKIGKGVESSNDSPEELSHYRKLYRQFVQESLAKKIQVDNSLLCNELGSENKLLGKNLQPDSSITHNSLVLYSLHTAANDCTTTYSNVFHIFERIVKVTAAEWAPMSDTTEENDDISTSPDTNNEDVDPTVFGFPDEEDTTDRCKNLCSEQSNEDQITLGSKSTERSDNPPTSPEVSSEETDATALDFPTKEDMAGSCEILHSEQHSDDDQMILESKWNPSSIKDETESFQNKEGGGRYDGRVVEVSSGFLLGHVFLDSLLISCMLN